MTTWPSPTMLDVGQEKLAIYDFGSPSEAGSPSEVGGSRGDVVLLHGMADVARSLEPLAVSLADRFRVVAFDARGHGRSSHPGAYSVLHFVADLAEVVDQLGLDHPILVGHSLGGQTVANYSGLFPERVRAAAILEGLGPPSVNPPLGDPAILDHGRAMVAMYRSFRHHRPQPDVEAAAKRLLAVHRRLDPDRALVLAEEGTRQTCDGQRVWRHDERVWQWVASLNQAELEQRWAAITAPVLAVSGADAWDEWWIRTGGPAGARQKLTDEGFAARLALFADIEHQVLADAAHMVHFDQPQHLNQLVGQFLDWVAELSASDTDSPGGC